MNTNKTHVKQAQNNIKNFDSIYVYYVDKIKNYLRPKVSNDEFTAEDLTSQTFEKAIKNIRKFKWQGASFSAWLYTIANNTLIDFYRKNKNTADISEDFYENIKDNSKLIEESLIENDTKSRIQLILGNLTKREKEVVKLKFYEGYTNKAIAKKLGLSETNIGTIIYRATKKLRDEMGDFQQAI